MADPDDAVMPVLQRIQKDIADFRKSSEAKANDTATAVLAQGEKLDEIESLITYHLGLTTQNIHDIKTFRAEFKDLKARVAALERRS
jgi:hypothetical protein